MLIALFLQPSVPAAEASGSADPDHRPVSSHSSAPPWIANVKVSDDTGSANQVEVDLAVRPDGAMVAGWVDYRSGTKCAFSASQDNGATWGANFLVTSTGSGITGDSTVAVDDAGNMYLICQDYGASDLKFAVSQDGGITFTQWRAVTAADDKPWLRGARNGTLFLTYTSNSNQMYRRSVDGGATWTNEQNLGSGNQGSAIAVGSGGLVHIAFYGSGLNYVRSKDFGATLEPKKTIVSNSAMGQFCFSCTPRNYGIVGGGSDATGKYVAYTWAADRGSGNDDVWIVYSSDGGDTFSAPIKASDDPGSSRQFQSWVAVDASGTAHVTWTDLRNGGQNAAYYANMSDPGKGFGPSIEITDGRGSPPSFMGDYKSVQVTGDTVHAVWCDSRSGNGDIYYSRAKVSKGSTIARIEVTPPDPTVPADMTQQFTATAYDTGNNKVNATFSWNSSGGSIDQGGLFTPQATGSFAVTASAGGKSGSTTVTVVHGALVSIAPSPPDPTVKADQTLRFTAEGRDSKGNAWAVSPAAWTVSGGADAGTIDPSGLYTPSKVGVYTISVTDPVSGKSGQTTVNVEAGAAARVDVTPPTAAITADEEKQFSAAAFDVRGNPVVAQFSWTATSGAVSSSGLFTPDLAGSWKVTAAAGAASGTADVTVTAGALAKLELSPDGKTITADETLQLTLRGSDRKGNEVTPLAGITWSADSGAVDQSALYAPAEAGAVKVKASLGTFSASVTVNVVPGELARVEVEPAEKVMQKGESATFVAKAFDAKDNLLSSVTVSWSLAGDAVGAVDQAGKLAAREAGEAEVRALVKSGSGKVAFGSARVMVRGGLLDWKGGGQLPHLLAVLAAAVAIALTLALARRRKRRAASAYASPSGGWPGPAEAAQPGPATPGAHPPSGDWAPSQPPP
jgi:hypothetical protein